MALAAGSAAAAPASVPCHAIGSGKYDCQFYPAGDGISAGAPVESSAGHRVGYLNHGTNYVYCEAKGEKVTSGSYDNVWWAYTLANDNKYGWVSAVYASGGANDGDFEGVPSCGTAHGYPPGGAPAPKPPPPPPTPTPKPPPAAGRPGALHGERRRTTRARGTCPATASPAAPRCSAPRRRSSATCTRAATGSSASSRAPSARAAATTTTGTGGRSPITAARLGQRALRLRRGQ